MFNYTLLSDGPSDRVLIPILDWLLAREASVAFTPQWAEFRRLVRPPRDLHARVQKAVELYPCHLLFVHRDAEHSPPEQRMREIRAALQPNPPAVCVVPVRMQEAWFLFDEAALRSASGNPNGRVHLGLPPLRRMEALSDPKDLLYRALITASGMTGRRRRQFPLRERVYRLTQLIEDYSPLRNLDAFQSLERELKATLVANGWGRP